MTTGQETDSPMLPDPLPSWYQKEAGEEIITSEVRDVFEHYSGFKPDEILPHVLQFRDRAFAVSPYACVGQFKFLVSRVGTVSYWPKFVEKLKQGGTLLDVGCGMGQEVRYLCNRHPEIPQSSIYGFDHEAALIDLGYDLFRDRDRCEIHLFAADLMDAPLAARLKTLVGKMDLIQCAQVLQMFDYDDLFHVLERLVSLTKPKPGSIIAGHNLGSNKPGSYALPLVNGTTGKGYRNSPESIKQFFKDVGDKTGTKWEVESMEVYSRAIAQNKDASFVKSDPNIIMLQFCATRL